MVSKPRNFAGSFPPSFYAIPFLVAILSSCSMFCDLRCMLLESDIAPVVNALSPGLGSQLPQHASRNVSFGERSALAVCVAVRDDLNNTLEWVEYHKGMGVDTFYMMVTDDPNFRELEEVLMPWIQKGTVHLFALPFVNPKTVSQLQIAIYSACLDSVRDRHHFIGFWDIDEYIVPYTSHGTNFAEFLIDNMTDAGGVALNWRIVGPSGHYRKPEHRGVLLNYDQCTPWNYTENEEIKSVVNTRYVVRPLSDPHTFEYIKGYHAVDCARRRVNGGRNPEGVQSPPLFSLHHYVTKSWEEYQEKMRRGSAMGNRKSSEYFQRIQEIATEPCPVVSKGASSLPVTTLS